MAYVSLYRKYRPDGFDKVIGQEYIITTLKNQVKSGNISHAYLFTGTRGTGKTSVARIFARAVNCEHPVDGSPCGKCSACQALAQTNMDIIEIDAASNNGVDDARDLRESVNYQPSVAKYKVYIIDEVHQLSGAAFNALLKTLEEPPKYVIFILATTELHKVPQTILSRCLKFEFRLISVEDLKKHVSSIFDEEGITYTDEAVTAIAKAGAGSSRDTLSFADACMSYSKNITYDTVLTVMGANNPEIIASLVDSMLSNDSGMALKLIAETTSKGKNIMRLSGDITECLRNLLIIKNEKDAKAFLELPEKLFALCKSTADKFSSAEILRALELMCGVDMDMKYSAYPRIVLETAVVKVAELSGKESLDLVSRLDSMERKMQNVTLSAPTAVATAAPVTREEQVTSPLTHEPVVEPEIYSDSGAEDAFNPDAYADMIPPAEEDYYNGVVPVAKPKIVQQTAQAPVQQVASAQTDTRVNVIETIGDDIFNKEVTAEMRKLKYDVSDALRKKRLILFSFIFSEPTTLLSVNGSKAVLMYNYDKEGDTPLKPDNVDALKQALLEVRGNVITQLDITKYSPKQKQSAIDKIYELFGKDVITIKNK